MKRIAMAAAAALVAAGSLATPAAAQTYGQNDYLGGDNDRRGDGRWDGNDRNDGRDNDWRDNDRNDRRDRSDRYDRDDRRGDRNDRRDGRFSIMGVTGPDEYTTVVDNNAYTNLMAKENLEIAVRITEWLRGADGFAYEDRD